MALATGLTDHERIDREEEPDAVADAHQVGRYVDAYNARDVDRMLSCLSEDVHFQNFSSGGLDAEARGMGEFAALARMGASAFRERRQTVTNCITVANRVMIEVDYAAVVATDLPNGWTAGQKLSFRGASYFELENDRIVKIVDAS
jgi:steroid delta-isomerase-like uncharacterized protein